MSTEEPARSTHDLRLAATWHVAERLDAVTADAVATFSYSGTSGAPDPDYCARVGHVVLQLLLLSLRDGESASHAGLLAELHRLVLERALPTERLYAFVYLAERAMLDELALAESLGAASDAWPLVEQLTRRASFDLLAAYSDRTKDRGATGAPPVADRLTTLYSRATLDAVLEKEVERATRVGYPVSLILFDVDRLSTINQEHGYGVGDRILERLGILIRKYFRQQDWVARYAEDTFAVLLTHTDGNDVSTLAERVRSTVEQRLGFVDHRDNRPVVVTLSAAVLNLHVAPGETVDPRALYAEAERTLELAKTRGRNRVERAGG